ncbi:MAG: hypothetical protein D6769_01510 [Methanobacteriota archaeon]|nr:MAG: hypothetical protein D6769_01510 [Euryarchaeota archaeon]
MKTIPFITSFSQKMVKYFPDLGKKLETLGMNMSAEEYMTNAIVGAVVLSILFSSLIALLLWLLSAISNVVVLFFLILLLTAVFSVFFTYMNIGRIDVYMYRVKKAIDYDLVFAVKHIIISVSSGTPLFDALVGATKGYGRVSEELKKIVERVALGESLTTVLREHANTTPSSAFKRVLIQIANSVVSGSNVAESLEAVINQVSKEQLLEIKEYGQKLNPIVMFYLILGVILPSLGVAFIIILLSFVSHGVQLPFLYLVGIAIFVGLIQFLFLAYIESTRPRYAVMS